MFMCSRRCRVVAGVDSGCAGHQSLMLDPRFYTVVRLRQKKSTILVKDSGFDYWLFK